MRKAEHIWNNNVDIFLNIMKIKNAQIQENQQIQSTRNMMKTIWVKHISLELLKIRDKEKTLKATRVKSHIINKGR